MNFLQLVARTWQEAGLPNTAPTAVTGQTDMAGKVVNWVLSAAAELHNEHNWRFNWATVTKALSANVDTYAPADWSISVKEWGRDETSAYVYKTASGLTSRQFMCYLPWEEFRGLNVPPVTSDPPAYWTVNPAGSVVYFPKPSTADWTVVHEYWAEPEVMSETTSASGFPAKYDIAIVWRAVQLYCGHDTATDLYQHATEELRRVKSQMEMSELPQVLAPGSLA